jgi:hypothetical protein
MYQSQEDFRYKRDILHCSPNFHGRPRFDGVLLKTEATQFGRLEGLYRCTLPSGSVREVALIRAFTESSWRPPSSWAGCRVIEQGDLMFVTPQYLIRGALLVDTDLTRLTGDHYFVDDVVDNDMFLRMGN